WELGRGYPLQVQQRKGRWLQVRDFEEPLGWVYAPLTSKTPHRVVTARVANLRAGPGQQHKTVGKLQQHEVVRSLGQSGSWARVQREDGQK
ncbi:SH3 domain-containing protein, partial [Colwellia marinimaniae]